MLKLVYKLGNIRGEKRQEFKQALWQVQVQSIQTSARQLANENARQPACAANAKDPRCARQFKTDQCEQLSSNHSIPARRHGERLDATQK
jgi:hypothetical protein